MFTTSTTAFSFTTHNSKRNLQEHDLTTNLTADKLYDYYDSVELFLLKVHLDLNIRFSFEQTAGQTHYACKGYSLYDCVYDTWLWVCISMYLYSMVSK